MTDRLDRLERHLSEMLAGPRRLMRSLSKHTQTTGRTMINRTDYPFTAWRLMPSFKPVEQVITGRWFGSHYKAGKKNALVDPRDLFDSKAACIACGTERLDEQQARITKQQVTLDKRRATLEKAK